MKTIQCAHPPHHHNGFVATCRLWTASGGVHALLVLEPTEYITLHYVIPYINPAQSLEPKMWSKDQQFHSFFSTRHI